MLYQFCHHYHLLANTRIDIDYHTQMPRMDIILNEYYCLMTFVSVANEVNELQQTVCRCHSGMHYSEYNLTILHLFSTCSTPYVLYWRLSILLLIEIRSCSNVNWNLSNVTKF